MQRPRLTDRLARAITRFKHSQDVPPAPDGAATPALVTQFDIEESTRVAQCLLDSGGLTAGQTVSIRGHRAMTVAVENARVVLVPAETAPSADRVDAVEGEKADRAP